VKQFIRIDVDLAQNHLIDDLENRNRQAHSLREMTRLLDKVPGINKLIAVASREWLEFESGVISGLSQQANRR
jgi:hypothetical protein